jgi:hypothetical protein
MTGRIGGWEDDIQKRQSQRNTEARSCNHCCIDKQ